MVDVIAKATNELNPTDILFQTPYWAQVKSHMGMAPLAFDIHSTETWGDVLVLIKDHCGHKMALVPQGPEYAPSEDSYGQYLEDLSVALADRLEPDVAFIRYDLPWKSLYADEMQEQGWCAFPEARIREMRMNMGTRFWNFKKASADMTVASSLVVDLGGSEDDILGRMKPKTRYNIGLARRKGVTVEKADSSNLADFYGLYEQTARRNGFAPCSSKQFSAMGSSFSALMRTAGATPEKEAPASIETPCSIRCGWACGSDTPSFFRLSATALPSSSWAVSSGSNDRSTGASTGRQVITSSRVWATVCLLSAIDTPYAGGTPGCFPKLCNTEDVCSQCYQNAHSGISQRRCKQGCISACLLQITAAGWQTIMQP